MSRKKHRARSIYDPPPPPAAPPQPPAPDPEQPRPLLTKDAPGMGIPVPPPAPEVAPSRYSKSPEELQRAAIGARRYGPESDTEELQALNAPLTRPGFVDVKTMDQGQLRRFAVAHYGKWYPDDEPEAAIREDVKLLMDRDRSPERRIQLGR